MFSGLVVCGILTATIQDAFYRHDSKNDGDAHIDGIDQISSGVVCLYDYVKQLYEADFDPSVKLLVTPRIELCLPLLASGAVDAIYMDSAILAYTLLHPKPNSHLDEDRHGNKETVLSPMLATVEAAWVFPQDSPLRSEVNARLMTAVQSRTGLAFHSKWFGNAALHGFSTKEDHRLRQGRVEWPVVGAALCFVGLYACYHLCAAFWVEYHKSPRKAAETTAAAKAALSKDVESHHDDDPIHITHEDKHCSWEEQKKNLDEEGCSVVQQRRSPPRHRHRESSAATAVTELLAYHLAPDVLDDEFSPSIRSTTTARRRASFGDLVEHMEPTPPPNIDAHLITSKFESLERTLSVLRKSFDNQPRNSISPSRSTSSTSRRRILDSSSYPVHFPPSLSTSTGRPNLKNPMPVPVSIEL